MFEQQFINILVIYREIFFNTHNLFNRIIFELHQARNIFK